jgi:class 3 adenylate cyclase/tetratricopeptide (TPR) repeat protein
MRNREQAVMGGEIAERSATVLFGDISGFTSMSERLDPEAVTEIINRCFADLEGVLYAHGGRVDKYVGDAIIGVFDQDGLAANARLAAEAALEMRAIVEEFRDPELSEALGIHVGIASGPILVGEIGGAVRHDLSIAGETVARGSRLEDVSARGEILVDRATYEATRERFDYGPARSCDGSANQPTFSAYELTAFKREHRRVRRASERREVTAFFAEIVGFDAHAVNLEPRQRVALLNRCFAACESAVNSFGGEVEQYVGTRVLAHFGARRAIEDGPRQAINAATELRRNLATLCAREGIEPALEARVGINSGLVVAGELGGRIRRSFNVIGDAVNVAARLKEAAAPGEVLIGPLTEKRVRGHFELRALEPLRLKGKSEPMRSFAVAGQQQSVHRLDGAASGEVRARLVRAKLVGRKPELVRLEELAAELARGRGGVVTLVGEAGLGKTRLIAELTRRAEPRRIGVLKGRSLPIGKGRSFQPFAEMLRRWVGMGEGEDDLLDRLRAALGELFPEGGDDILPFVAAVMGARLDAELERRLETLRSEALEQFFFRALSRVLVRAAKREPLLLVFEDAHWMDLSSIKLLQSLLNLSREHAVLFLVVCRPDYEHTGEVLRAAVRERVGEQGEIVLTRLSDSDCDALILELLEHAELPWETRSLIVRKARGNPLFIEEVVLSLIDQGVVVRRNGRFFVESVVDHFEIPGTIREVVMTRIDRLPEAERRVVQLASVLGQSFDRRVLAAVSDDPDGLDRHLANLEELQLLLGRVSRQTASVRRVALETQMLYSFDHALIRDAVYDSILQRTRREMHARVGRAIEEIYRDRLADAYGMLAFHYAQAEEVEKAEEYLFKAGEEAARAAASAEALEFFRDASLLYLQLYGDGGEAHKKARLERNLALALFNTGELPESIDHFDKALAYLGWRVPRSDLTRALSFAYRLTGVVAQLYLGIGRSLKIRDWEREREAWEVLFNRGRAEITSDPTRLFFDTVIGFYRLNQIDASRIDQASAVYASCATVFCYSGLSFGIARRALARARRWVRPGNIKDEFTCKSMEFILPYLEGDWDQRWAIDDRLIDEALQNGQLWDVNTYIGLRADQLYRMGRWREAEEALDVLDVLDREYGFQFADSHRIGMLSLMRIEQRRLEDAAPLSERYRKVCHEDPRIVFSQGSYAKLRLLQEEIDESVEGLEACERAIRASRIPPWHLSSYAVARLRFDARALAAALTAGSGIAAARRRARRSAGRAIRLSTKIAIHRTEIHRLAGRVDWLSGRTGPAMAKFTRAMEEGERMRARPELARTWFEVGRRLLEAQGPRELAGMSGEVYLDRAATTFEELDLEHDLERLFAERGDAVVAGRAAVNTPYSPPAARKPAQ